MAAVVIGRITAGGRIHLRIDRTLGDGWRTRTIRHPASPTHINPDTLCRRCFTPARIRDAQAALATATGQTAEGLRQFLADQADRLKTPAERDADTALIAAINATLDAAAAQPAETPTAPARRTLADLRAEFMLTHPQPGRRHVA